MTILYCLDTYPRWSETFIQREIDQLRERGCNIKTLAFYHDKGACLAGEQVFYYGDLPWIRRRLFWPVGMRHFTWFLQCILLVCWRSIVSPRLGWQTWRAWRLACLVPADYLKEVSAVHAHFAGIGADLARFISWRLEKPFSVSVHGQDIFAMPFGVLRVRLLGADKVFCCHQKGLDYIGKNCERLLDKLVLMFHGLPKRWFAEVPGDSKRQGVLAVGRLVEKKNFELLVAAWALLLARGNAPQLTIIGDGTLRPQLERKIKDHGLCNHVLLAGKGSEQEIISKLDCSELLICPSKETEEHDQEGIPNVVLEAMARRTLVLAADTGAIAEIVEPEKTGVLLANLDAKTVADTVLACLKEDGSALIEAAYERVSNDFSAQTNVSALENYFASTSPHV